MKCFGLFFNFHRSGMTCRGTSPWDCWRIFCLGMTSWHWSRVESRVHSVVYTLSSFVHPQLLHLNINPWRWFAAGNTKRPVNAIYLTLSLLYFLIYAPFLHNTNRMYSWRAFIWVVTSLGFVWQIKIWGLLVSTTYIYDKQRCQGHWGKGITKCLKVPLILSLVAASGL